MAGQANRPAGKAEKSRQDSERRDEERLLDKSIEDTFPASDPSAVTRAPRDKRETGDPDAEPQAPKPAGPA